MFMGDFATAIRAQKHGAEMYGNQIDDPGNYLAWPHITLRLFLFLACTVNFCFDTMEWEPSSCGNDLHARLQLGSAHFGGKGQRQVDP